MSLIPMLVDLTREFDDYDPISSSNFFDDDFGFGIYPGEIFRPRTSSMMLLNPRRYRYSPYNRQSVVVRGHRDFGEVDSSKRNLSVPNVGKDGFQVCMDVSHFKPNELTVKTVENQIVVEGKHEEREDEHGMITRQFVRKYSLPKGYDAKDVVSTISSDGVLTVKAPPPLKSIKNKERVVQIQQTGPAHLNVKDITKSQESSTDKQIENNKMDTSGK